MNKRSQDEIPQGNTFENSGFIKIKNVENSSLNDSFFRQT